MPDRCSVDRRRCTAGVPRRQAGTATPSGATGQPPLPAGSSRGPILIEDAKREKNWKRWGPYLAERQWGTVREDYSATGECWEYFPHDHARSRVYRWGEDGLLGVCDRECRLCFALALWNGRDPILKERLFGLTSKEGNHGEDVRRVASGSDLSIVCVSLRPQRGIKYRKILEIG